MKMRLKCLLMEAAMTTLSCLVIGCATTEQNATKTAAISFITTPASYYTSAKARYLGTKYKENLDRLAEHIVRNPKTAGLQFANNIASVGGIGFFTHSAASTADERFLEVIVSAPETFESQGGLNSKLASVFSAYGTELLSILAGDSDIYQEKEVSGYGLNLTWRNITPDSKGTRVILERAVIYVSKEKVRAFLHREVDQRTFLADAIIFTAADNGPMKLVTYRQQDPRPDTRLPIHEESLVDPQVKSGAEPPETVKAVVPSMRAAGGAREEQVAAGQPVETIKEDPDVTKQSRDPSRNKLPEATKSSDPEATIKKTVVQPQSTAAKTPDMPPAVSVNTVKISEEHSVTKPMVELSEFKRAEAGAEKSRPQKADHEREVKPASDVRRSASVSAKTRAKTGPDGEIVKAAVAEGTRSQGSTGGNLAPGTSRPAPKSADDNRTAVLSKSSTNSQGSLIAEAGATLEKKVAPLTSEGLSIPGKNSLGGGSEPQRLAGIVLPTKRNPVETGKAVPDKTARERMALQKNKTSEIMPNTKNGVGPQSRALEGYIIQLAFKDKGDARRWAETMEQRGYAVSVTEAGGAGAVRVRVGNFIFREEADRQLMALKQEGLAGIVINLPQAYLPDVRAAGSDGTETHPKQLPH
ncbi:MAG: SPOR domain-containing protein [Alphaproteobacteria bacterium]